MQLFSPFSASTPKASLLSAGSKAQNLLALLQHGIAIPKTLYIHESAYAAFVSETHILPRLKEFLSADLSALRWEEIWDIALRVRHLFSSTPLPDWLESTLLGEIEHQFGTGELAIRSCSSMEDSVYSHAGLHDSFLHSQSPAEHIQHIRLVWASLWSDRSLLYRREMQLQPESSSMGVLVQEMQPGQYSGIMFTVDPTNGDQSVIEAHRGSAEDAVSDAAETERLLFERGTGKLLVHRLPQHSNASTLPEELPLRLFRLGEKAEQLFTSPQDIEWTVLDGIPVLLQSRPITTLQASPNATGWRDEDKRPWYMSLTRSYDNLKALEHKIDTEILPGMDAAKRDMDTISLSALSCEELEKELMRRRSLFEHWRTQYWKELIPFAHAIRLFGMLYNDALAPDDPFAFTSLLSGSGMLAIKRNTALRELAAMIEADPTLQEALTHRQLPESGPFAEALHTFMQDFGDLACNSGWCEEGPWGILKLLQGTHAEHILSQKHTPHHELEDAFFAAFPESKRETAQEILALARKSYQLRDDDNVYLGKIQSRYDAAVAEAEMRLADGRCSFDLPEKIRPTRKSTPEGMPWSSEGGDSTEPQAAGWAAAPGLAHGKARVIHSPQELFDFQEGEILVCDALDPNMTFVVPLAKGIVERRGGMLVHGAIIAREYGIPCVTGVHDATKQFRTGEELLVDGYRGAVLRHDSSTPAPGTNVLGGKLLLCGARPATGFMRTGFCATSEADRGTHVICARMTNAFLAFTREQGNDLTTPAPEHAFPGLQPGDFWCLCAGRWKEALEAGIAPPVLLAACEQSALSIVSLSDLTAHALDTPLE